MIYLSIIFLVVGLVFLLGGCIGILRMPDFYTRLHPAGKLDTMGIVFMVLGFISYNLNDLCFASLLLSLKMLLIVGFLFLASPTATHAIVDAGIRAGLLPWSQNNREGE